MSPDRVVLARIIVGATHLPPKPVVELKPKRRHLPWPALAALAAAIVLVLILSL